MNGVPGSTPGCGTVARYSAGCRCDPCRHAKYQRDKRRRLTAHPLTIPGLGTTRRIQALRALGWPTDTLGARLGITGTRIRELTRTDGPVLLATATRVARLYNELCMTPGPSARSRAHAARQGWAPPLAWDDIDTDPAPNLGTGTRGLDLDEWARLVHHGEGLELAARRCGVTLGAVERAATRQGRRDVLDLMRREAAA